jgi:hypothetical protein
MNPTRDKKRARDICLVTMSGVRAFDPQHHIIELLQYFVFYLILSV